MRLFAALLQTPEMSSKASCRLCTAEVRGSNPLGSPVENAVLQEKREPRTSSPTVSQAFVQGPTYILVVGVLPRSALAHLTEPRGARRGRWRRTARSPSPRSGRRRTLCQSSTSRATRVCPSPRARGHWTRRGSWWRGPHGSLESPEVRRAVCELEAR